MSNNFVICESDLLLDLYFYEQELLEAKTEIEKEAVKEKIDHAHHLILKVRCP